MRRARRLDGLEADEAADAVVDMDDEIALGERGDVGEEIGGAALGVRAHQTVAENVLLADQRERLGLEAGFEAEHGERRHVGVEGLGRRPVGDRLQPRQAVIDQHLAHAVAGALAPAGDDDALAGLDGRARRA